MKRRSRIIFALFPLLVVGLLGYLVLDDFHLEEDTDIHARIPTCEESAANFHAFFELLAENVGSFERKFSSRVQDLGGEDRRVLLLENRDVIRAHYAAHAPHRALIRQIANEGWIGDPTKDHTSPTLNFQNFRDLLFAVCLHAELSVADPETEDDLEDFLALYKAMLDWAHHTRTILHTMISWVSIDRLQKSLAAILADPGDFHLTPRMRALLTKPHNFVEAVSRAAWGEYCFTANYLDGIVADKNFFFRLVLNRNRTLNLYAAFIREQNTLASEGRWDELAALYDRLKRDGLETSRFKNPEGGDYLRRFVPAMSQVFKQAHKIEAQRTALLEAK